MNRRLRGRLRRRKLARDGGITTSQPASGHDHPTEIQKDGARIEWESSDIEDAKIISSNGFEYPLGVVLTNRGGTIDEIKDRLLALETGEIDPGKLLAERATVDPEELLPLHQKYNAATNLDAEQHGLTQNQEIAARLFPYLPAKADLNEGRFILRSPKVKQAIGRELGADSGLCRRLDVENPNPATVRRVMEFIAQFSDGMIELVTDDGKTNYLVWDRRDWLDYEEHVEEATLRGGHDEL